MINVENIYKTFKQKKEVYHVLNDISIDVRAGEIVTLLGESGCGKSTLLHAVGGFILPDKGSIYINERLVQKPQRDCVMLFQQLNLLPWNDALSNVELGLKADKKIKRELAKQALAFVGLNEYHHAYPHELSGGMQQRVAIARAFAMKPKVILMDEPFAALDSFNRYHLQDELIRLQKHENLSILLVTHDIDEAIYLSDRIYIMSAKPGEVFAEMSIELAKPRIRTHQDFQYYRRKLLEKFKLSQSERKPEYYI